MGGLGAPDLELYYRAAQGAIVHSWIHGEEATPYLRLERLFASPRTLPELIFEREDRRTGLLDSLNTPRHAWQRLLQLQDGTLLYSPDMPIEWMAWLAPCRDKGVIRTLKTLNSHIAKDLFSNGSLKTWGDIRGTHTNIPMIHRFQYHRIRHSMAQLVGRDLAEPPEVKELSFVIKSETPKQLVSSIYKIAQSHRLYKYTKARLAWQADLNVVIDDAMWTYCCANIKSISLHGRHRLIHFKFINRVYYTPERLHRYGLKEDASCEHCKCELADFMHLAWQCLGVATFWKAVFRELSSIVDLDIQPNPTLALVGYSKPFPKKIRRLLDMGLLIARRRVALNWMKGPTPTMTQWSQDLLYCCTQTETFSELLPPQSRPKNFWSLYTTYLAQRGQNNASEPTDLLAN